MSTKNEQKSSRDRKQILFICIICILLILIYGILLCMINPKRDILENEVGLLDIDGWSMTHFIFFFFLGYLYPGHLIFVTILSILWELIEYMAGIFNQYNMNELKNDQWSDIPVNILGYLVGQYIRLYI